MRQVIVDADLVVQIAVQLGVLLGAQNIFEHARLRYLFGLEVIGVVRHKAVAITEYVGREPAAYAERACAASQGPVWSS